MKTIAPVAPLLVALLVVGAAGTARADDDPESRVNGEVAFGIRAPAMMHLGDWAAMNIGFEGAAGLRFKRLAVLVEGAVLTMWPASWPGGGGTQPAGCTEQCAQGSMQRLGVETRWSIVHDVSPWRAHSKSFGVEQQGVYDVYAEIGAGIERIHIDGDDAVTRRDLTLGIGGQIGGRDSRQGHFIACYATLRVTIAGGEPTPDSIAPAVTAGAPGAPALPLDVGVGFSLGMVLGG